MKILVVGGGGREHAIITSIAKSSKVTKIYCAPGNAGIAELAECVDIGVMEFDKLVDFAKKEAIDLAVVAPDDPLVAGAVDAFEAAGIRAFGPRANAAIIEGSKAFSKDLMKKYNIPTAAYENFTDAESALAYLETASFPIVLKADGLALGKGVLICKDLEEAKAGVKEIMLDKHFGNAGNTMVIEEFMTGREVSVLAFCDGTTIKPMTSAQDHKRAQDGDQGLNTGGMGTFSPSPFYTDEIADYCMENIYKPTMAAMKAEGREFKGVLFCGLMITPQGVKVLEYNARFGDPEAQVVLPRMKNDIIDVFEACIDGTLDQVELEFEDNAAVCVVLASDGYPVSYKKGYPISGLETFKDKDGYYVFHAGTKFDGDKIVTNGGRVLGVVAKGENLKAARANAYKATEWIDFAKQMEEAGADALEINILALQSELQYTYGSFEQRHIDILRHIKKTIKIPVIMKLGDNLTNPVALIDQLYANGAAAVVLFNRFYQPDINIEKMEHISGEIFSNASDLAIPLRWIGIASAVVDKIDYAASGGVANAESVVKAILAGASAVEVCSAVYLNTNAFIGEANRFLSAWMERKGFRNIAQFKGKLNIKDVQGVNTFERTQFLKYFGKKE